MSKSFFKLYAALGCIVIILMGGCTESKQNISQSDSVVTSPSLTEIPPIPTYTNSTILLNTDAVCWIGVDEDATWNNLRGDYARQQFITQIQPLIHQVLVEKGFKVVDFDNQYMTRQKRLSVNRILLCKNFEIKKTRVNEGMCYDMKLTLAVVDNLNQSKVTDCEIWGRSVVSTPEQRDWSSIYQSCVSNLCKAQAFQTAVDL